MGYTECAFRPKISVIYNKVNAFSFYMHLHAPGECQNCRQKIKTEARSIVSEIKYLMLCN